MDPSHQFDVTKLYVFRQVGGAEIAFTISALYMLPSRSCRSGSPRSNCWSRSYVFAILTCIYLSDAIHGGH